VFGSSCSACGPAVAGIPPSSVSFSLAEVSSKFLRTAFGGNERPRFNCVHFLVTGIIFSFGSQSCRTSFFVARALYLLLEGDSGVWSGSTFSSPSDELKSIQSSKFPVCADRVGESLDTHTAGLLPPFLEVLLVGVSCRSFDTCRL